MSTASRSILAGVLRSCTEEEGGVRALARALGVSPGTLYALLNDERPPSRHVARAVADYLSGRRREDDELTPQLVTAWAATRS